MICIVVEVGERAKRADGSWAVASRFLELE